MKKFLVLLLVLGLASAASAAVCSVVTTEHEDTNSNGLVDPSEIVWIKIVSTVPLDAYSFDLHVTGPGTLLDYGVDDLESYPQPKNRQGNNYGGNTWFIYEDTQSPAQPILPGTDYIIPNIGTLSDAYNSSTQGENFVAGDLVWALAIHCDGPGDVIVNLTPGVRGSTGYGDITYGDDDFGDITIHQVPEPMTLGLLGLGGLALLRRRRA